MIQAMTWSHVRFAFPMLFACALALCILPNTHGQTVYQDTFFVDFDYDPDSPVGPEAWDTVDTSNSEWFWYDEGHPIFNLAIDGDGEPEFSGCGSDNDRNSPLALFPTYVCEDTHEILTRQISSETDCTRDDLSFVVTPYTLKAYMPLDDASCERPSIQLAGLEDEFILVWMEVHARAEHVVDGRRYDAELQMVHMGTGDSFHLISTVSVLIDTSAGEEHKEFQFLLDGWQKVANAENEACNGNVRQLHEESVRRSLLRQRKEEQAKKEANPKKQDHRVLQAQESPCKSDRFGAGCEPLGPREKMYPYSMWPSIYYYGYRGSITTPPCADIVNWRILDEPMKISKRQYKQLTNLLKASRNDACDNDTRVSPAGENFRPLQQFNPDRQSLFHCTYDNFSLWMYPPEEQ